MASLRPTYSLIFFLDRINILQKNTSIWLQLFVGVLFIVWEYSLTTDNGNSQALWEQLDVCHLVAEQVPVKPSANAI